MGGEGKGEVGNGTEWCKREEGEKNEGKEG